MKSFLIFFYIVATIAAVSATDYCAIKCKLNDKQLTHIACGHDGLFASNCPSDIQFEPVTEDLKEDILNAHNLKRNLVAGGGNSTLKFSPACRMATIQWDDELAKFAGMELQLCRDHAESCHSTALFPNSSHFLKNAKQSIGSTYNATAVIQYFVDVWFNWIVRDNVAGSMLVDRNIRLGCAITTFILPRDYRKEWTFMCSYSTDYPHGTPLYATCQIAGKSCNTGRNYEYPNLCSKDEIYN